MERVGDVKIKREELETTLLASVPKWRSDLLTSVSVQTAPPLQQGLPYQSTYKQTQTSGKDSSILCFNIPVYSYSPCSIKST